MSDNSDLISKLPADPRAALQGLASLLEKVDRERPDPAAVSELQGYLDATPDLWRAVGDLGRIVRDVALAPLAACSPLSARMSLEKGAEAIRAGLGYAEAPQLEKLLIDHVELCWLQLQLAELHYMSLGRKQLSLAQAQWQEKRLDAAQRRYLRACETLARVRKLTRQFPSLQLNVALDGGRQVNVSGDVGLTQEPAG